MYHTSPGFFVLSNTVYREVLLKRYLPKDLPAHVTCTMALRRHLNCDRPRCFGFSLNPLASPAPMEIDVWQTKNRSMQPASGTQSAAKKNAPHWPQLGKISSLHPKTTSAIIIIYIYIYPFHTCLYNMYIYISI